MVRNAAVLAAWHDGMPYFPPRYPLTICIISDMGLSGLDGRSLPIAGRMTLPHSWSAATIAATTASMYISPRCHPNVRITAYATAMYNGIHAKRCVNIVMNVSSKSELCPFTHRSIISSIVSVVFHAVKPCAFFNG